MLLASAAMYMRNSDMAKDTKWFELWTGHEDDNGERVYLDARPFQPLTQFLLLAEAIKHFEWDREKFGEMPNAPTSGEMLDAVVGVRGKSDSAILGLPDIAAAYADGDWEGLKAAGGKLVGGALGSMLSWTRAVNDLAGGMVQMFDEDSDFAQRALVTKTTMDQEFIGGLFKDTPGLREVVKDRVDPFTGEPTINEHPLQKQLFAMQTRKKTPWQRTLESANMTAFDLVGNWKSDSFKRGMQFYVGQILARKDENGETLNQRYAAEIEEQTKGMPVKFKKSRIQAFNKAIQGFALQEIQNDPDYSELFKLEQTAKVLQSSPIIVNPEADAASFLERLNP
jgi:hypothetical protein